MLRKTSNLFYLVLIHAEQKIVGHTSVKSPRMICHDVYIVLAHLVALFAPPFPKILHFIQNDRFRALLSY